MGGKQSKNTYEVEKKEKELGIDQRKKLSAIKKESRHTVEFKDDIQKDLLAAAEKKINNQTAQQEEIVREVNGETSREPRTVPKEETTAITLKNEEEKEDGKDKEEKEMRREEIVVNEEKSEINTEEAEQENKEKETQQEETKTITEEVNIIRLAEDLNIVNKHHFTVELEEANRHSEEQKANNEETFVHEANIKPYDTDDDKIEKIEEITNKRLIMSEAVKNEIGIATGCVTCPEEKEEEEEKNNNSGDSQETEANTSHEDKHETQAIKHTKCNNINNHDQILVVTEECSKEETLTIEKLQEKIIIEKVNNPSTNRKASKEIETKVDINDLHAPIITKGEEGSVIITDKNEIKLSEEEDEKTPEIDASKINTLESQLSSQDDEKNSIAGKTKKESSNLTNMAVAELQIDYANYTQEAEEVSTLTKINQIEEDAKEIKARIINFIGIYKDTQYLTLNEALVRNMIKLDDLSGEGDDDVRNKRKKVMKFVQECLETLERNAGKEKTEDA